MPSRSKADNKRTLEQLIDIYNEATGLSEWEEDFIESLVRKKQTRFSDKQAAKIQQIHVRKTPGGIDDPLF